MKRNEEHRFGEKFCMVPFFFNGRNEGKTYKLIGKLEGRQQSSSDGDWYQMWEVMGSLDNIEYHLWTRECDTFEEKDF